MIFTWNNKPQALPGFARRVLMVAALGAAAFALSACSTTHRVWENNKPILRDPTADQGGGKDAPGAKDPYPKVGLVPDRPKSSETSSERRKISSDLVSDREKAPPYSNTALKAGQEPAAAPPPPPVPGSESALPVGVDSTPTGTAEGKTASADDSEPGFFARLFWRKKSTAPDPNKLEPLPAQPTKPVTVEPGSPAAPPS